MNKPARAEVASTPGAPPRRVYPLRLLGGTARLCLAPGNQGRVLAVFRRSFYLHGGDGGVACLGSDEIGMGPLNALYTHPAGMDWQGEGLAPGGRFRVQGNVVRVGERLAFPLAGSQSWRPAGCRTPWTMERLSQGLFSLMACCANTVKPRGLGILIARRPDEPYGDRHPEGWEERVVAVARDGQTALTRWLQSALSPGSQWPAPLPLAVEKLIGLGPGLTPAGDDFLGGAMIALHALSYPALAAPLAGRILARASHRTSLISRAHLACAARGEGAEALHDLLAALCASASTPLALALRALDAIGHTSGWDALAGAVTVCSALTDAHWGAAAPQVASRGTPSRAAMEGNGSRLTSHRA